jgi:uncharacterized protein
MLTLEDIKAILKANQKLLADQYGVERIAVFGSRARQDYRFASDVDIMVELRQPVGWEIVDIQYYLEQLLGMKVDLVTKGALSRKPLLWESIREDLVYV